MPAVAELRGGGTNPYGDIEWVGVGLTSPQPGQLHAALLYRSANDIVMLLHFCWQAAWAHNEAQGDVHEYRWVRPRLRSSRAKSLAVLCQLVAEAGSLEGLPFAFDFDESAVFSENTGLLVAASDTGFTCATFVMTMFASIGARLFDYQSWPNRPCDTRWFMRVIRAMAEGYPQETSRLAGEVNSVRYRPEEVVASTTLPRPVPFDVALTEGRDLVNELGQPRIACWFDRASDSASRARALTDSESNRPSARYRLPVLR